MSEAPVWQTVFGELRRRKVFRVATLYVIVLWPLIQLVDILQPMFRYPDSVISTLLYLFIGGFPVALALAWLFDLTREGVVRSGTDGTTAPPLIGRTAEAVLIGALTVLVLALFLVKMNIDRSADVAGTAAGASTRADVPSPAAAGAAAATSIAVLPFTTISADEQDQVFADGLTEELLNQLARVQQLRVAARTSSFAYKGVNRAVQEIGRELGVGKILEGSVRRSDVAATIRITAQLIDVESGAHLWSQTYDREYRDVLRIQDEIASAVAEHLSVQLLGGAAKSAESHGAAGPEALIAVSRGRASLAKRSSGAIIDGIAQLEQGVRASPAWAEAQASLAEAYVLAVLYSGADRDSMLAKAQAAATRALELDPQLGCAWAAQGLIHMQYPERRAQSLEALQRAVELNPSYAMAYMWLGSQQGDPDRMLQYHRKALELDPRSAIAAYNVATDLLDIGKEDEAMQVFEQIVAADPFYPGAYLLTAKINERHGRLDEAILDYQRGYELDREASIAAQIAKLYVTIGEPEESRRWLERAEGGDTFQQISAMWVRAILAKTSGDATDAENWLERIATKALEHGDIGKMLSGYALALIGRDAEAIPLFDAGLPQARETELRIGKTDVVDVFITAANSYRVMGRTSDADRVLVEVRNLLEQRLASGRADPALMYQRARLYLLDGDARMAFATLDRAAADGWTEAWRLRVDPLLKPLAGDPRLRALETDLQQKLVALRRSLAAETSA